MSRSNSLDFASLFHGVPPLPPPPPPIPNPTGPRRRKGKEKLLADRRFWTDPPKPTTATLTFNAAPSPEATTTWSAARRSSTTEPAKAPQVQDQAAEARKDEQFNRADIETRVRKLLVVDDEEEVEGSRPPTPLNVFAVVKKPAAGKASLKPANKQRPKAPAVIQDPSYRPDKWSSSEFDSDEDSDWDFVPGDLPAFGGQVNKGQEQFSPITTSSLTSVSPPRPPGPPGPRGQPRPPPPIPKPLKRKRMDDPTYRPSGNSEESGFDDDDEEDDESDEGVEALKGIKLGKNDNKNFKKRGKGRVAERRQPEKSPEKDKRDMLTKGRSGDEKQKKPIKKKGMTSVWDPSYKPPPRDEEEDDNDDESSDDESSDDESSDDEYTSTDGGSRRRRKRIRVPEGGDGLKDKDDGNGNPDDNPEKDVIPQEEKILPCQARPPCLPPKFGRHKIKQRRNRPNNMKPPHIHHDPSYKPGTTSTDDDSNSAIDSSWSFSEEGKDRKRKRKKSQPKEAPKTQTVSDQVIRLMLAETKKKSASAMTKKRKRPQILRRHTSDQAFRPSDTTSDEYSDEWYSSEYSSELDVKNNKKRKKGTKKNDQPNVNRNSPELGPVTTGREEDLDCGSPVEASEETTKESVKPEKQPASRKKTGRRRIGTLAIDGTYKQPSADSESSEFGSEPISGLDHSVSSMKISKEDSKPELIFEPKRQDSVPPVNLEGDTPQVQTPSRPLSNVRTAFYPLCHGRYSPWPPARGTVYCQSCFREQVMVRGLLIRRGISEMMRLLKVLLGGGSDFGKELDEALEKVLRGVETEQMRSTRVEDYGQGQGEEDEREERVQRGRDTHTKPVPSAQSSLPELPEDVQTLLVLRRLSDIVNTRSMPTLFTAHPSGSDISPTKSFSLYFPPIVHAVFPKPSYQQQDPTGPSRYSSPQGNAHNCTGNGADISMSYFYRKPPLTRSITSRRSQSPLDDAINILHDAIGISTWQARRLWNQYEGSGVWDLAQVDSLVKKSHAKFLKNSDIEVGMGNDENHQAVMLELEGLAQLEEEIRNAFAEKGSREEENEDRTRQSDGGGTGATTGATRSIMFGAVTAGQAGRKRSRDDDDDCRLGRDHAQTPSKKCKLIKPIDLLNPKSQEALPVSPQRTREKKPRMIPCHSCSGFNTANCNSYNSCAAVQRTDYIEMGGRPWVKTLQWTLDIDESEAAKMTLNSFLDLISRSGKAAHVKSSGWEFVVHRPGDDDDAETRIVFLDVRPGLDLHL